MATERGPVLTPGLVSTLWRVQVMRTKPIEDVLAASEQTGLRRRLGALDLAGIGVGIVIGTGIFTLTGVAAQDNAGPAVAVSFAIAGVVALLAALSYAELAAAVPTAGSAYTYAYATVGELVAWIIGWDLVLEFALAAAVVSRGWSGYLASLFDLPVGLFGEQAGVNVGAIAIVLVLGGVAAVGIRQSSVVTNVLVALKVAICIFIVIAGAFLVRAANLTPFVPPARPSPPATSGLEQPVVQALFGLPQFAFGIAGVLTAAAVVFFAYTGFEAVANLGEETRRPARDMPRGLLGTLALATVLYVGVAFVVVGMADYRAIDTGAPISDAFRTAGEPWAAVLVSLAAVAGLTSVLLVELITLGRIGFAMGRDGLIPPAVSAVHPRFGTPFRLTVGVTVVVALIAGFVPLTELADLVSIGALFAFVLVSLAVPILRRTRPELHRPFRVPLSPVLPLVTALACLFLMANLDVQTWLRFAGWLVAGLVIYGFYGRRHARLAARDAP